MIRALEFSVAHMNDYQFAVASMIGVLLGWLYERTRSLIPCSAWALQRRGHCVEGQSTRGRRRFRGERRRVGACRYGRYASMAMLLRLLRPSRAFRHADASAP